MFNMLDFESIIPELSDSEIEKIEKLIKKEKSRRMMEYLEKLKINRSGG